MRNETVLYFSGLLFLLDGIFIFNNLCIELESYSLKTIFRTITYYYDGYVIIPHFFYNKVEIVWLS